MTRITMKEEDGKVVITADGHSGYAPAGEDIVCAGVSALMFAAASAAMELEDAEIGELRNGYMKVILPVNVRTQLLINSLRESFEMLELKYEKFVTLQG